MNRPLIVLFVLLFAKAEAQTSASAVSDSLYAIGNYSEAIENLNKIGSKDELVYLKLAQNYRAKGNYKEALEHYKKVLTETPNRVITTVNYGNLLFKTGQLNAADSLFSDLVKKYPKNANFQYQLGAVKLARKDSTYLKSFYKAIYLDETHQKALREIAEYQLRRGYFPAAKKYAKQGLKTNPTNVSLLSILAQAHFHHKNYKKATVLFTKLVELGQGNAFVHSSLGMAYYRLEDYKNAKIHFQKALELENGNSTTHFMLGLTFKNLRNYEEAKKHLETSIVIKNPSLGMEFFNLGLVYKAQEKHKKALHYYEKALEENPDHERALYERAIAADNYFADLKTRMNYYRAYLNQYESSGNERLILLAKNRIQDIREELHQKEK
ncbi:MAG TPA: tetratricopeptide repeat protein [Salinimicrobium sp.]|nr:tetratricopeptide repeat protein [Salinimicrobium sp.]